MLFSNKKTTILFDQVIDQVKNALIAIDAYPGAQTNE